MMNVHHFIGASLGGIMSGEADLTPHPLMANLGDDLRQTGGLAVIVGYVGSSQTHGRVRVYLDLSLGAYCEVARGDVVKTAPVDAQDENSPTIVWVNGTARVEVVKVVRMTAEAAFTSGSIQSEHLREAVDYGLHRNDSQMGVRAGTQTVWCCPIRTLEGACESRNIFCPK
jgi:hypothetical protein